MANLCAVFTEPIDTGKEIPIYKKSRRKGKLFYDIAQGMYIHVDFFIHVGDPIIWGKKQAFISSFVGFYESDGIKIIRINLDGKLINITLTEKVKN